MDTLKKYEKQINDAINKNANLISKCENRIAELKAEIDKAQADMVQATESIDTEAFRQAKRRKSDAEDELGMLEGKLKRLNREPMMSVIEYEQLRNDLFSIHKQSTEEHFKKYRPLVKAMLQDLDAATELDENIDKLLATANRQVMRIGSTKELPEELKDKPYTYGDDLRNHPVIWFLNNLRNIAEEEGIV